MKNVSVVVFDFDGVMTDNHVWVHQSGTEAVRCHRGDGLGISRLKEAGFEVIILSTEANPVVAARCRKLKIEAVHDCHDKLAVLQELARERNWDSRQIAYVGNDLNDVECLRWVGWPIAVADATPEVHALAKWVTRLSGGRGAVREVADRLVRLRHDRDPDVDWITERIWRSIQTNQALANSDDLLAQTLRVARSMTAVLRGAGRVFLFGDEGSAPDVQYLATELKRVVTTESSAPVIIALTVDNSLKSQARVGDMAIALSVSGLSPHLVREMEAARRMGLRSVALTGTAVGDIAIGDECISVPSSSTTSIRESHILIGRIMCDYLERANL